MRTIWTTKRTGGAIILATLVALFIGVTPADAKPNPVTIEAVPGIFATNIEGCITGTFELPDQLVKEPAGNFDKLILNIMVERTFYCDGSDDYLRVRFLPKVRGVPFPQTGPWRVVDGRIGGDDVHGTGSMSVVMTPDGPFETFSGTIHIG